LDEIQSTLLNPLLNKQRDAKKITGLLCVVSRSFRPCAGMVTIELQIVEVDQRTIAALRKIARV
jgi:hypothetical protein